MFSNEVTLMRKHTCHDRTIKREKLAINPTTMMPPCSWLQPDCPSLQDPQFCQYPTSQPSSPVHNEMQDPCNDKYNSLSYKS